MTNTTTSPDKVVQNSTVVTAPPPPPAPASPPPKFIEGMLALCKICGYTGIDFTKCQRLYYQQKVNAFDKQFNKFLNLII